MHAHGVPFVVCTATSLHKLCGKSLHLTLQSAGPSEEEETIIAKNSSCFSSLCSFGAVPEHATSPHGFVRLQLLEIRSGKPLVAQLPTNSSQLRPRVIRSIPGPDPQQCGKDNAQPACSTSMWKASALAASPPPVAWQQAQVGIGEALIQDAKAGAQQHLRLVKAFWDAEQHPGKVLLASASCDGDTCDAGQPSTPEWRWQTLNLSANYDTVECVHAGYDNGLGEETGPRLQSVMVRLHEEGSLLALVVSDTEQRSCVIVLTHNLQPLRHVLWCNYNASAVPDRRVLIEGATWLAGTRILALVDVHGCLGLLDFSGKLVQMELSSWDGETCDALPQVAYESLLGMGRCEGATSWQHQQHVALSYSLATTLLPGPSGLSETWPQQLGVLDGAGGRVPTSGTASRKGVAVSTAGQAAADAAVAHYQGLLALCNGSSVVLLRYQVQPLQPLLLLDTLLVRPSHDGTSPSSESIGAPATVAAVGSQSASGTGASAVVVVSSMGTPRGAAIEDSAAGTSLIARKVPLPSPSASMREAAAAGVQRGLNASSASSQSASPALLLTMPPSPLAATLASQQLFSPHSLLRHQAPVGVSEKSCSWPVVHKALTTFGSGFVEEMRLHSSHDAALLRAPSQLSLFEPDPLRSSMGSMVDASTRSVASTRVSMNTAQGSWLPTPPQPVPQGLPPGMPADGASNPWLRDVASAGSSPVVIDADAYAQLQQGTAALLEGRPSASLTHFVQAHVFGFLPCVLVLLQHLQVMPCITLLRSFVTFLGTCCSTPQGGNGSQGMAQAALQRQLSAEAIRSGCTAALRTALSALLPGEPSDVDATVAMALAADRLSAPCSAASGRESAAAAAAAAQQWDVDQERDRGSAPCRFSMSSEPSRTSGAPGAPQEVLDPGFISLVHHRSTAPQSAADGVASAWTRDQGRGSADGQPQVSAGPQPAQQQQQQQQQQQRASDDGAGYEVGALLAACKQQLAVGCRCLAFLSHKLHTHASMLQQLGQLQRSSSLGPSPLASPSYPRLSQQRSLYLSRMAAGATSAPMARPSLSSPIGMLNSRLSRTSIQCQRGATGVDPSAQALMVGLPMPVVWHQLAAESVPATSEAPASPASHMSMAGGRAPLVRAPYSYKQLKAEQFKAELYKPEQHRGDPRGQSDAAKSHATDVPLQSGSGHLCSLGLFHSALDVRRLLPDASHPASNWSGAPVQGEKLMASAPAVIPGRRASVPDQSSTNDVLAQLVQQPPPAAEWFLEPAFAVGLLLMAFACEASNERDHKQRQMQDMERGSGADAVSSSLFNFDFSPLRNSRTPASPLRQAACTTAGTACSRLNWQLLHAYPPAAQGAALWKGLGDWRKAAVLAFTVHQMVQQRSASSASINAHHQSLAVTPSLRIAGSAGRQSLSGDSVAGGGSASASCLTVGLSILREQVARCHGMEVQEACITLHELVAIPRHVLGHHVPVYGLMLRKVCDKLADLLPKRLGITQLLPPSTSCPSLLLHFCHYDIRHQLRAQLARGMAKVCAELQLTMGCSGAPMVMGDAVQQVLSDPEVEACIKMLLRWQGCYDAGRLASSIQQASAAAPGSFLFPDAGSNSWEVAKLLNVLELTLSSAGVLPPSDLSSTIQQARRQLPLDGDGESEGLPLTSPSTTTTALWELQQQIQQQHHSQGSAPQRQAQQPLVDLNNLALLVDFAQIAGTLLACIQPHLHDALPYLQRELLGQLDGHRPSAHSGWLPIAAAAATPACDGHASQPEASSAAGELAAAVADLLRQLVALDWAMVCRAHVASLLAQLLTASGTGAGDQECHRFLASDGRRKSFGSVLGARSLSQTQVREHTHISPAQLVDVQTSLLAWCASLVKADRYHVDTEMQAAVHSVLSCIGAAATHAPVLEQVSAVEAALRGRNLFNAKLAEQISRLKKAPETSLMARGTPAALQQAPDTQQQLAPFLKPTQSMPKPRVRSNSNIPAAAETAITSTVTGSSAWQAPAAAIAQLHAALMDALRAFAAAHRGGGKDSRTLLALHSDPNADSIPRSVSAGTTGPASEGEATSPSASASSQRGAVHLPSRVLRHRSLLLCMLDTLVHQPSHFTGGEAVTDGLGRLLRQDLRDCFVHPLRRWPWHHNSSGVVPDSASDGNANASAPMGVPAATATAAAAVPAAAAAAGGVSSARSPLKGPLAAAEGTAGSEQRASSGLWMNSELETQQELAALLDAGRWLQLPPSRIGRGQSQSRGVARSSASAAMSIATASAGATNCEEQQPEGPVLAHDMAVGALGRGPIASLDAGSLRVLQPDGTNRHAARCGADDQARPGPSAANEVLVANVSTAVLGAKSGQGADARPSQRQGQGIGGGPGAAASWDSAAAPAATAAAGISGISSWSGLPPRQPSSASACGVSLAGFWHDDGDAGGDASAAIGASAAHGQRAAAAALLDQAASRYSFDNGAAQPSTHTRTTSRWHLARPLHVDVPVGPPGGGSLHDAGPGPAATIQFLRVVLPPEVAVFPEPSTAQPTQQLRPKLVTVSSDKRREPAKAHFVRTPSLGSRPVADMSWLGPDEPVLEKAVTVAAAAMVSPWLRPDASQAELAALHTPPVAAVQSAVGRSARTASAGSTAGVPVTAQRHSIGYRVSGPMAAWLAPTSEDSTPDVSAAVPEVTLAQGVVLVTDAGDGGPWLRSGSDAASELDVRAEPVATVSARLRAVEQQARLLHPWDSTTVDQGVGGSWIAGVWPETTMPATVATTAPPAPDLAGVAPATATVPFAPTQAVEVPVPATADTSTNPAVRWLRPDASQADVCAPAAAVGLLQAGGLPTAAPARVASDTAATHAPAAAAHVALAAAPGPTASAKAPVPSASAKAPVVGISKALHSPGKVSAPPRTKPVVSASALVSEFLHAGSSSQASTLSPPGKPVLMKATSHGAHAASHTTKAPASNTMATSLAKRGVATTHGVSANGAGPNASRPAPTTRSSVHSTPGSVPAAAGVGGGQPSPSGNGSVGIRNSGSSLMSPTTSSAAKAAKQSAATATNNPLFRRPASARKH